MKQHDSCKNLKSYDLKMFTLHKYTITQIGNTFCVFCLDSFKKQEKTNFTLTRPAGQTATLAAHWVAAVRVETVAPLGAVQPKRSFLLPEQ